MEMAQDLLTLTIGDYMRAYAAIARIKALSRFEFPAGLAAGPTIGQSRPVRGVSGFRHHESRTGVPHRIPKTHIERLFSQHYSCLDRIESGFAALGNRLYIALSNAASRSVRGRR